MRLSRVDVANQFPIKRVFLNLAIHRIIRIRAVLRFLVGHFREGRRVARIISRALRQAALEINPLVSSRRSLVAEEKGLPLSALPHPARIAAGKSASYPVIFKGFREGAGESISRVLPKRMGRVGGRRALP